MKIKVGNTKCLVEDPTLDEVNWLLDYTKVENRKARYSVYEKPFELLYDARRNTFPAGLVLPVARAARKEGFPVKVIDEREPPCPRNPNADIEWLRDYQKAAVFAAEKATKGIIQLPTGAGKCLGKDTPVLMYCGAVKKVQDVKTGDKLMGPDSKPRTVKSTCANYGQLYKIVPVKGEPWVCNDVHVLTLIHTETGNIVDVPLNEWQGWSKWRKHCHKLFQPERVDFSEEVDDLPVDPYFFGVWLGDGAKNLRNGVRITKPDPEIKAICETTATKWGLRVSEYDYKDRCITYGIVGDGKSANPLTTALSTVFVDGEVDTRYLTATREGRLQLLAGILDTDGYLHNNTFEIVQKRAAIADCVKFIARSLGFRVSCSDKVVNGQVYKRLSISGDCSVIPNRINRKKASPRKQKKNQLRTGFSVEPIGEGEYFGFTLDGDGRFLLGDFTVTHNTEVFAGLTRIRPCHWMFIVHRKDLMHQAGERFRLRTGLDYGVIGDGRWEPDPNKLCTVATFQTLYKALSSRGSNHKKAREFLNTVQGIVVDEVHSLAADTFLEVSSYCVNAYYRIGLSGTALDRSDSKNVMTVGATGPIVHKLTPQELIDRGLLAEPEIKMYKVTQMSNKPTYQGVYGDLIVRSAKRNSKIVEKTIEAEKPCLVFVKQLKHGKELESRFQKKGVNVDFTWGEKNTQARKDAIKRLVRGDTEILICSVIFEMGIDIPELRSVVIGSGGKSVISAIQRVGRGMRVVEGKSKFQVIDIFDDLDPWMEKHSAIRKKAYERNGYKVEVVEE